MLQAYDDTSERRVAIKVGDSILRFTMNEPTGKLDKSRQANGISPNWVHSLDGCALRMSVNRAVKKDVRHFAMVHDSYGVMPTDAPVMAQCLREAFVDMCTSTDVLEDFKQSLSALLSEEQRGNLKPLPSKGTLDITAVLDSVFFFA